MSGMFETGPCYRISQQSETLGWAGGQGETRRQSYLRGRGAQRAVVSDLAADVGSDHQPNRSGHSFGHSFRRTECEQTTPNVTNIADFSTVVVCGTSFGTRGSQVQILPLRPLFCRNKQSLRPGLPQVDGRTENVRRTLRRGTIRGEGERTRNRHCRPHPRPWLPRSARLLQRDRLQPPCGHERRPLRGQHADTPAWRTHGLLELRPPRRRRAA